MAISDYVLGDVLTLHAEGDHEIIDVEYIDTLDEPNSPRGSASNDGSSLVRTVLVDWDDLGVALKGFLGFNRIISKTNGSSTWYYISRLPPHGYPDRDFLDPDTAKSFLYAQDASWEGLGLRGDGTLVSVTDTAAYRVAKIAITYKSLLYKIEQDSEVYSTYFSTSGFPICDESLCERFVTKRVVPAAEYLTLPDGKFYFASSETTVPGRPGKVVPKAKISLTWHGIPEKAVSSQLVNPGLATNECYIDNTIGHVNLTSYLGCAQGTLLCEAPQFTPYISNCGQRLFEVVFNFLYLPVTGGHNAIFDPGTNTYRIAVAAVSTAADPATDGRQIYDYKEFRNLFKLPTPV